MGKALIIKGLNFSNPVTVEQVIFEYNKNSLAEPKISKDIFILKYSDFYTLFYEASRMEICELKSSGTIEVYLVDTLSNLSSPKLVKTLTIGEGQSSIKMKIPKIFKNKYLGLRYYVDARYQSGPKNSTLISKNNPNGVSASFCIKLYGY